ncbi:MAG: hypothetical protein AAGK32_20565, partial [Actinomycetota bacterium]
MVRRCVVLLAGAVLAAACTVPGSPQDEGAAASDDELRNADGFVLVEPEADSPRPGLSFDCT